MSMFWIITQLICLSQILKISIRHYSGQKVQVHILQPVNIYYELAATQVIQMPSGIPYQEQQ